MIFQVLIDFAVSLISGLISGLSFFSIPLDFVNTLATVCVYGNWLVGADVLLLFAGCVSTWFGIKLSAGVVLFVYRLIPLCG